jgi:hypothetical protein
MGWPYVSRHGDHGELQAFAQMEIHFDKRGIWTSKTADET